VFNGNEIRGLEQNPDTKSRWAQMARSGKKVMQFLSEGRYVVQEAWKFNREIEMTHSYPSDERTPISIPPAS